jgi:diguanylate cyclase (GGDEF)-like protein
MDSVDATPQAASSVDENASVISRLAVRPGGEAPSTLSETRQRQRWDRGRNEIVSAIVGRHSLPSTMQRIADAFVGMFPSKAIAIATLSGPQLRITAQAGLPRRLQAIPIAELRGETGGLRVPFEQILEFGIKLCFVSPLVSVSGDTRGVLAVFDEQQEVLNDPSLEMVLSLCDLARLAMDHSLLYEQVVHRTQYDRLTGLPNRFLMEDRLRQAIASARRQRSMLGVCCIGLDQFKQISDSLGREVGDSLLKLVSRRLSAITREFGILGRLEGDEFLLAIRAFDATSSVAEFGQRVLKDLCAPFPVGGRVLTIGAQIGISIFPDDGDTAGQLLRNAEIALQEAKRGAGDQVQIYSAAMGRRSQRAVEMVDALARGISQIQFHMAYQPIFTMEREIAGFEALLRWKHPQWGNIEPPEFIPVAERSGQIVPLGDWVIGEVCRQAQQWNAGVGQPVKLFANVSSVQLAHPEFTAKIADALARSGLDPECLELEITESWIIADLEAAAAKLRKLRKLGIGIAIDDFGAGYSNFHYLQALPLDTLKIDRSFIHRLDGSAGNLSTVRAITGMARELGLKTVAEGVETESQLRQLREIGCEMVQGFLLGRPVDPQTAWSLVGASASRGVLSA